MDKAAAASLAAIERFERDWAKKRPFLFYNRYPVHSSIDERVIWRLLEEGESVALFCGEARDPALSWRHERLGVYYLDYSHERLFARIESALLITPATSFRREHRPRGSRVVHMYHSIVSMTHIYPPHAFDGYDVFLAVGPHHREEIGRFAGVRGWRERLVIDAGYPKIENLTLAPSPKRKPDVTPTVLVAPSWGEHNLIRRAGERIVRALAEAGCRVVVRPHPHSLNNDKEAIAAILAIDDFERFGVLEDPGVDAMASFLRADLMVSDWSGAAYEYAFGRLRPVLFVDGPQKINNPDAALFGYEPMEKRCREEVGAVCDLSGFEEGFARLLAEAESWEERIRAARARYLYHPYDATETVVRALRHLQNGGDGAPCPA